MKTQYILINETNFEKVRKKIDEEKKKTPETKIIFSSEDDELNRKIVEKLKINSLLISFAQRKDFQKQRNSGLNQVIAKEMNKNNIKLGINLNEIINKNLNKKQKAEILARIKQNINLCKKNKVKIAIISNQKRDIYDIKSLGLVLGIPTQIIKEMEFIFFE